MLLHINQENISISLDLFLNNLIIYCRKAYFVVLPEMVKGLIIFFKLIKNEHKTVLIYCFQDIRDSPSFHDCNGNVPVNQQRFRHLVLEPLLFIS